MATERKHFLESRVCFRQRSLNRLTDSKDKREKRMHQGSQAARGILPPVEKPHHER